MNVLMIDRPFHDQPKTFGIALAQPPIRNVSAPAVKSDFRLGIGHYWRTENAKIGLVKRPGQEFNRNFTKE